MTSKWVLVQDILSEALQEVLQKGRSKGPATPADIHALLDKYSARLQATPKIVACSVVAQLTPAGNKSCQVPVATAKSYQDLGPTFDTKDTEGAILAKLNGQSPSNAVSVKKTRVLLVPRTEG
jgi:hypothetical protein